LFSLAVVLKGFTKTRNGEITNVEMEIRIKNMSLRKKKY
jgi:hypothetical protein